MPKNEFSEQAYNRKGIKTNSSLMTPHETENLLYMKERHHYSKDAAYKMWKDLHWLYS